MHDSFVDPSAGASDDWAYHVGAQYSYTVELPPANDDGDGFILPENRFFFAVDKGLHSALWYFLNCVQGSACNQF